jgi:UDP-glucose 4-epimerase
LAWYKKVHNIRYVALRYFNAAGYDPIIKAPEREPTNLLPILMEAVVGKRDHATIFGDDYDTPDGTCIRDYIHVTDLADAHVKAIDYLNNNEEGIFNLGTGKGTSVCECIDAALRLGTFTVITAKRRPGDPAIHYTDATRAQQELGWTPKYSDMDTILKSMHAVYKNRT